MKEHDIRPRDLFGRFLAAAAEDAADLAAERNAFSPVRCPGCGGDAADPAFEKQGFAYVVCDGCASLYASPRPTAAQLDRFYERSKAAEFFATDFYRDTEAARRARLFEPRARLIAEVARRFALHDAFGDIGAGYGTLLEEVRATGTFARLVAIEPGERLAAECRAKGFDVLQAPVEQLASGDELSMCAAFEVFEHVHDPFAFVSAIARLVRPGGIVLMTTLTISGFDLQELWCDSNSIMPPHHLNFVSVDGMRQLLARCGLEVIELTTPGELDVDIVGNALAANPAIEASRFARQLVASGEPARREFQQFLKAHALSSHLRVMARRP